jgi:quinol monooxygenase YgiN
LEESPNRPMNKYGLIMKITVQDGKTEDVVNLLLEASRLLKNAKGLHLYMVSKSEEVENQVIVTELWDTKEDHDESLKIDGVMECVKKCSPFFSQQDPFSKTTMKVQGGFGVSN